MFKLNDNNRENIRYIYETSVEYRKLPTTVAIYYIV